MADHRTSSSEDEVPKKRTTRANTRLRKLLLRKAKGKKTHVIIEVVTGQALGCNGDLFISYLGVLARDKISILTPSFDHVSKVQWNMIWQDIMVNYVT